jgi:hypothetical protein
MGERKINVEIRTIYKPANSRRRGARKAQQRRSSTSVRPKLGLRPYRRHGGS